MSITPYLAGSRLRADMLTVPQMYQTSVGGGPTSGSTELVIGTLVVPAQPIDTIQYASAFWSGSPDSSGSLARWRFRIRDTNVSGTIRAGCVEHRPYSSGSATARVPFAIANAQGREIAAGVAATYVVTIANILGSGTIEDQGGQASSLSVMVLPDL